MEAVHLLGFRAFNEFAAVGAIPMQSGKVDSCTRQALKVLIKTGGMEGLAASQILTGDCWQLLSKKERVTDATLHTPVLASLIIPGR